MEQLPPALPHGRLEEIFPDVFFVSGAMKTELMGAHWQFSRNMTVVRDGDALTLINPIRLGFAEQRKAHPAPSFGEQSIQRCKGSLTTRDASTSSAVTSLRNIAFGLFTPLWRAL